MEFLIYSVEDDKDISNLINITLSKQGYQVISFYDGKSFIKALAEKVPDMILLDIMLPGISGLEILEMVRKDKKYNDVDVIIISAKSLILDKVQGFELGADDYIDKPFNILELISRVNAKVRRKKVEQVITFQNVTLNLNKHICYVNNEEVQLTSREFEILALLFKANGSVLSREEILSSIWGVDSIYETRTVDMHIKSLRQKINDLQKRLIATVHGVGYRINI
jgi:two-component system alkaline phosphatase synthesis response regulator PhoP